VIGDMPNKAKLIKKKKQMKLKRLTEMELKKQAKKKELKNIGL